MQRLLASLIAALLLAVPGFVYLAANKSTEPIEVGQFAVNYLYMAAPHILVAVLALRFAAVKANLLIALVLLNISLAAFVLWIHLAVPGSESGLAWVLYIPVSAAVLLLVAVAAAVERHRIKAPTTSAR